MIETKEQFEFLIRFLCSFFSKHKEKLLDRYDTLRTFRFQGLEEGKFITHLEVLTKKLEILDDEGYKDEKEAGEHSGRYIYSLQSNLNTVWMQRRIPRETSGVQEQAAAVNRNK